MAAAGGSPPRAAADGSADRLENAGPRHDDQDGQREIVALRHQLYLVVTEPAMFADEVLGTLTTGFALDDATAAGARAHDRPTVVLVAGRTISAQP